VLTDIQNSFTGRRSGKFLAKQLLDIPPLLIGVATLPCEKFVLKNCSDRDRIEADFRARVSPKKQQQQQGKMYWHLFTRHGVYEF